MKQYSLRFIISIFILTLCLSNISAQEASLIDRLVAIPNVTEVKQMESTVFSEKYLITFEHYVNYNDYSAGKFTQRVFVSHVNTDSATVLVTEGYGAQYAARAGYREEVSKIFNTNLVVVEHRYFLESTPKEINWNYLTAEFSARDLHEVVTALKSIYPKKWIATGISKGGQTVGIYRTFFPEDIDISIPYVAPLCRDAEDGRHEPFIANYCGTKQERKIVKDFQIEALKRKKALMPRFDSLAKAQQLTFNLPNRDIYDYCVLEFSFALWQWGTPVNTIPSTKASDSEIFKYLMNIAGPDYFQSWGPTSPFFVQAAKELGYYGYDVKPFRRWIGIKSTQDYLQTLFLPQDQEFRFDPTLYEKMSEFIRTTDAKMLYIYGQYDPWSAVMIEDPGKENIKIFIDPAGSHRARIGTFPEETQKEIKSIIAHWLYN